MKFNDYERVSQALNHKSEYLYQYDYFLQTPIHWAAKLGYDKILELMLKKTARCNIYDKKMRTPLYLAAMNDQKKCVELLLRKGADPYLFDWEGKKPEEVTTRSDIKIMIQTTPERPFSKINDPLADNTDNEKKNAGGFVAYADDYKI